MDPSDQIIGLRLEEARLAELARFVDAQRFTDRRDGAANAALNQQRITLEEQLGRVRQRRHSLEHRSTPGGSRLRYHVIGTGQVIFS